MDRTLPLLLLVLPGLCDAFNLDERRPRIFRGPREAQFGYKVLQHVAGGRRWILASAPWAGPAGDRRGDVYRCPVGGGANATCVKGHLGDWTLGNASRPAKNVHLGMSLLQPEASEAAGFMACAPLWSRACGSSVFSSGVCTRVDEAFQLRETLAPTAQRCPTYMDIVMVLDGSNSIYPWADVQTFLRRLLAKLFIDPEQIQVGLVQYGERPVHEWSLGDFRTKNEVVRAARSLKRREGRETRTAQAIHSACTEGFSPSRGGRPEATRLLVVVTDGESHDGEDLPGALRACETLNVTRYGIAVLGHYLRRQRDPASFLREIRAIASDPDDKFFFNVTDEAALTDIVDALGDRIFGLEGSHEENESSFGLEMSQIGFSVHAQPDGILFGMVGAYDWGGSVLWLSGGRRLFPPRAALEAEFPPALQNHAAYLGYSVSSLVLPGGRRLLLSGAPRFQHRGKVVAFELGEDGTVRVARRLLGEQIGSYFGSELCPVDVDGDGVTDVLLVAAPMFLGPQNRETGRVYMYSVGQGSLRGSGVLRVCPWRWDSSPQDARLGWALAVVRDVNADGLADVAVGAPLEDGHRGALYLFHGARPDRLSPTPKQRVAAASLAQGLSYFGRSVDGRLDMDGDQLVDVVVGAQGAAVLLSSRPIVHLSPSLSVTPAAISLLRPDCRRRGQAAACLTARLCFRPSSRSPGRWDPRLQVRVWAALDEAAAGARAGFDGSGPRLAPRTLRLSVGNVTCHPLHFHVLDTTDYLRPLALVVSFALDPSPRPEPVLDEDSPSSLRKMIPFFKDCGSDDQCVTDLALRAQLDVHGSRQTPFVVRGGGRQKAAVSVTLENRKENAYNASLDLSFSRNLHLASLTLQRDAPVKVECTARSAHARSCSVGHPVFQAGAEVTFLLEFEFSCTTLQSRALVTLTAGSDSLEANATLRDNTVQLEVFVRYEPDLVVSSETTLHRYEVHPHGILPAGPGPEFKTTFRVQNLGCFPVDGLRLSALLPAELPGGGRFLSVTRVLVDNASCVVEDLPEPPPRAPPAAARPQRWNCSWTRCQAVRCHLGRLAKGAQASVGLLRAAYDHFFRKAQVKTVTVVSSFELGTDNELLTLPEAARRRESLLEVFQIRQVPVSLWIFLGSVVGGLLLLALIVFCLWKLGFFSRKKVPEGEEETERPEQ
ncbi:integrin alpha-10 [Tachyglossus aculeatus]|uniref:integrin alpha-10 n=1 Tax=Tachyglossus aculeatus TaxID=9261 RepID=UPI0018F77491|nr:integrin alpha-10 [Tachyglossus aculeatus]